MKNLPVFHFREALYQAKRPGKSGNHKTNRQANYGWNSKGQQGPFYALRLLFDRQAGGRAGPMHQAEQHGADSSQPGPAVIHQQFLQGSQIGKFSQASACKICHNDNRYDNLIGRKAEDKSKQNYAVHSKQIGKRVKEIGT